MKEKAINRLIKCTVFLECQTFWLNEPQLFYNEER